MFNLAIDSRLRGCDLVKLTTQDMASGGKIKARATFIQQKTGKPVPFELTDATKEALAAWLSVRSSKGTDWLWPSRSHAGEHVTTRQYGRLVDVWIEMIGLDPADYGTHSLRRTTVSMIYKRTGNLSACQLLLGHTKLESTLRYLGVDAEDALQLSEQTDL